MKTKFLSLALIVLSLSCFVSNGVVYAVYDLMHQGKHKKGKKPKPTRAAPEKPGANAPAARGRH